MKKVSGDIVSNLLCNSFSCKHRVVNKERTGCFPVDVSLTAEPHNSSCACVLDASFDWFHTCINISSLIHCILFDLSGIILDSSNNHSTIGRLSIRRWCQLNSTLKSSMGRMTLVRGESKCVQY